MKLKYISLLPVVLIMGLIFYFSSKPAEISGENSLKMAEGILCAYENATNISMQEHIREQRLNSINLIIRKGAHVTEYALLAIAIAFHLWVRRVKGKRLFWLPIIIASLYAVTDEIHQLYVPGRSGELRDVGIDTIGAIIGSILFYYILTIYERKKTIRREVKPE